MDDHLNHHALNIAGGRLMQDSLLIVILAILSMIGALGIDTYLPSFPAIASTFAVSPVVVQQTLSVFVLCMAALMLFYGTLSDSFGRRPVLLVSLALFAITSFACALATSAGMLIFLRALQGLSAGAGSVVGRAVVQDHFKGHDAHRATAIMTMVFGPTPTRDCAGDWRLAGNHARLALGICVSGRHRRAGVHRLLPPAAGDPAPGTAHTLCAAPRLPPTTCCV